VSITYQRLPELSTEERQYHIQDQIEFAGIARGGAFHREKREWPLSATPRHPIFLILSPVLFEFVAGHQFVQRFGKKIE
jgi:hypothetical protein